MTGEDRVEMAVSVVCDEVRAAVAENRQVARQWCSERRMSEQRTEPCTEKGFAGNPVLNRGNLHRSVDAAAASKRVGAYVDSLAVEERAREFAAAVAVVVVGGGLILRQG